VSPTPEQRARQDIDAALAAAGWVVQDRPQMNLAAGPGVAVREFRWETPHEDLAYDAGGPLAAVHVRRDRRPRLGEPRSLLAARREPRGLGDPADPHVLAQEIADDLRSALAQIDDVLGDLEQRANADASRPE
jgi:hypothetical protein